MTKKMNHFSKLSHFFTFFINIIVKMKKIIESTLQKLFNFNEQRNLSMSLFVLCRIYFYFWYLKCFLNILYCSSLLNIKIYSRIRRYIAINPNHHRLEQEHDHHYPRPHHPCLHNHCHNR